MKLRFGDRGSDNQENCTFGVKIENQMGLVIKLAGRMVAMESDISTHENKFCIHSDINHYFVILNKKN